MKRRPGFSLVELLVVMAIISILAFVAVTSFGSTRGANVTNAAEELQGTLKLARQLAVSQNRIVEARFYQTEGTGTANPTYSSLRLYAYDATAANPLPASRLLLLPAGVVMVSNTTYSTLLSSTTNTNTGTENLPGALNTPYSFIQFRPSGLTNLTPTTSGGDQWFVSIKMATDATGTSTPANNFATVQVNPVSGATLIYQP